MAFNYQRRPSSWFGPQFTVAAFNLPSFGGSFSSRGSFSESRRSSNLKPTMQKLPMPEPLFHDSYLSEEDISPTTPDPNLRLWGDEYQQAAFPFPKETLEDFGLAVDDDPCDTVATYVSMVRMGKPKVVDIPPPSQSREQSPRPQVKAASRPPIVWRMPSYESTTNSSEVDYALSDRSESFDSRSTYTSSLSERPKTPSSFFESVKGSTDSGITDSSDFLEPRSRSSISRASTLRRHSRNLSASFSKAFFSRLKETEVPPSPPVPRVQPSYAESSINYSLSYSATRRPQSSQSYGPTAEMHMPLKQQYLAPLSRHAPVLRRKKSIAGSWF